MKMPLKEKLSKLYTSILNTLFPKDIKCIFCGGELSERSINGCCEECQEDLPYITSCCDRCGLPMNEEHLEVCNSCKRQNYEFEKARSVFSYISQPLALVRKVKFRSKKIFIPQMAKYLYETFKAWNISVDVVTFVPMYKDNEKVRGFNQSQILAEEFCALANLPITYGVNKKINTPNQRDLSFAKRKENIKDAFEFKHENKSEINNKTVLIIDDVFTTGATTNELAKTLKQAKAKNCYVLTFAHTIFKDS